MEKVCTLGFYNTLWKCLPKVSDKDYSKLHECCSSGIVFEFELAYNPLSANPAKSSNTQAICRQQPTNCLSVSNHSVGLALTWLTLLLPLRVWCRFLLVWLQTFYANLESQNNFVKRLMNPEFFWSYVINGFCDRLIFRSLLISLDLNNLKHEILFGPSSAVGLSFKKLFRVWMLSLGLD